MTKGLIRKTIRKFGAAGYLRALASELESESREMEDIYSGGGRDSEIWSEEINHAINRAIKRINDAGTEKPK